MNKVDNIQKRTTEKEIIEEYDNKSIVESIVSGFSDLINRWSPKKRGFVISIVFSVYFLSIVLLIILSRTSVGNPVVFGSGSYQSLVLSESSVGSRGISEIWSDNSLDYSRPVFFNVYYFFLSMISPAFALGISVLAAIIIIVLLYMLLREFNIQQEIIIIALFLLASSPSFIFSGVSLNSINIALFLSLFSVFLAVKGKCSIVSFVISAVMPLFGFIPALCNLGIHLLALFFRRQNKRNILTSVIVSAVSFAVAGFLFVYSVGIPDIMNLFLSVKESNFGFFSDFGVVSGFSVFAVILFGIGLIRLWEHKKRIYPILVASFILILLSFFSIGFRQYFNIILAFIGAFGLYYTIKRKWSIPEIRNASFFILILGLFFSVASFINNAGSFSPDREIAESLAGISHLEKGVVLSHGSNSEFILFFSGNKVIYDSYVLFTNDFNERINDTVEMFSSRNLKKTASLFDKYEVKYIFISPDMKTGVVWEDDDEGLLFLFRNSETFKRIYSKNEIEIWEYLGFQEDLKI